VQINLSPHFNPKPKDYARNTLENLRNIRSSLSVEVDFHCQLSIAKEAAMVTNHGRFY